MTEQRQDPDVPDASEADTDADPGNLNPRDERGAQDYDGDPDADPGNLNPRDT